MLQLQGHLEVVHTIDTYRDSGAINTRDRDAITNVGVLKLNGVARIGERGCLVNGAVKQPAWHIKVLTAVIRAHQCVQRGGKPVKKQP